jgi:hypothetical protein
MLTKAEMWRCRPPNHGRWREGPDVNRGMFAVFFTTLGALGMQNALRGSLENRQPSAHENAPSARQLTQALIRSSAQQAGRDIDRQPHDRKIEKIG